VFFYRALACAPSDASARAAHSKKFLTEMMMDQQGMIVPRKGASPAALKKSRGGAIATPTGGKP
jgi:hypothetical protein